MPGIAVVTKTIWAVVAISSFVEGLLALEPKTTGTDCSLTKVEGSKIIIAVAMAIAAIAVRAMPATKTSDLVVAKLQTIIWFEEPGLQSRQISLINC